MLAEKGFEIVDDVYSAQEVTLMLACIESADGASPLFRRTGDLFAIRQVLHQVNGLEELVFNSRLRDLMAGFGEGYKVVKSIYFDKPGGSNWFVAYHQDLTISVRTRLDVPGFGCWTVKEGVTAVQPPPAVLENMVTVRIHLDDTDEGNGALKVIPGSHLQGIVRVEGLDRSAAEVCRLGAGGVMLMKPLLMHASGRTMDGRHRRVIHIELSDLALPGGLEWAEIKQPGAKPGCE